VKQLSPQSYAVALLLVASLAMSGVSLIVLATTPVAKVHSASDRTMVFDPIGPNLTVNATFPPMSSVAFHWNVYGFASNLSISIVDPFSNTVYGRAVDLSGSAGGSGGLIPAPGTYEFDFGGLNFAVAEVYLVVTYTYLSQSPLI
jgi:hypothetical protein